MEKLTNQEILDKANEVQFKMNVVFQEYLDKDNLEDSAKIFHTALSLITSRFIYLCVTKQDKETCEDFLKFITENTRHFLHDLIDGKIQLGTVN